MLIHAATGGVGQAALQLARHWNTTVYTTASRPKWPVLHELGLTDEYIASSRDTEFEHHFRARLRTASTSSWTAWPVTPSTPRCVCCPPGGRFLEMGKTDIRDADTVARDLPGPHVSRPSMSCTQGPYSSQEMLAELHELFASGGPAPLPLTAVDIRNAQPALRHLAQARHTGKLVLTLPPAAPDPEGRS